MERYCGLVLICLENELINLQKTNSSPSRYDTESLINVVFSSFQGAQYPSIPTSGFSENKTIYLHSLFEVATIQNIVSLLQMHKNNIISSQSLTTSQKNRLL